MENRNEEPGKGRFPLKPDAEKPEHKMDMKAGHENSGMAMRGVSRPMAEKEIKEQSQKRKEGQEKEKQEGMHGGGHNKMQMNPEMKEEMLHMHHMQTLWVYWLVIILGFWTLLSPLTFNYDIGTVQPSGGREVWLSLEKRIILIKWSDIISGALLIVFGWRGLTPNRPINLWICCFVGIWMSMAPIIFWSPSVAAYINGTLIGALVIALTVLVPGMPNMLMYMEMGPETPPGWTYNPSSWPQRWIMIVTGFAGWMVSRYLAAFQLGYIDVAWDPFFATSSMKVLNSSMSHSLPISDAGLGSLAYTFEFLMGWMGSPARWRTMPWMVTFFGILVIPLGLVHIFLVISQPVVVGAWCTLCLLAAAIMLPMIPLEVDEVIAMGQYLVKAKRKGQNMWKAFWKGGTIEGGDKDVRSPKVMEFPQKKGAVFNASVWGISFPWTLTVSMIIGIWLMFSPAVFGIQTQTPASNINHLAGALIVVVSVISMGEVLRMGRWLNVLLGVALAASVWFTENASVAFIINALFAGITVAALAIPRGPKTESYAGWDKYVR